MDDILEFARKVAGLKRLKRTGWVIKGVKSPESVAEHSFMLAILAYAYSKKLGLNTNKCVKMALVHDLCEAYSGDIPSRMRARDKPMPDSSKKRLELHGLNKITSLLPKNQAGEIRSLWKEFEARKSRESKLVKDLDKLEMCMQALEYAKSGKNPKARKKFAEFFEDGEKNIRTPEIRKAFKKILRDFDALNI
jgi:putative hydrolase of HD superfamily